MNLHYDESAILDYVSCDPDFADREAIEEHLQQCAECRRTAREVEEFIGTFGEAETWSAGEDLGQPDPVRVAEFVHVAERRASEAERATRLMKQILAIGSSHVNPEEITTVLVSKLLDEFVSVHEKDPRRAFAIAKEATDLAMRIDQGTADSVEQIRGRCWKDQANALRYLGRFPEALAALDEAETHFRNTIAADYHLATVDYVRASVLRSIDRGDDALELLRRATPVFAAYGDDKRTTNARIAEGGTLFSQSRYAEAREVFNDVLGKSVDPETVARVMNNVGHCNERLGDATLAIESFNRAATAFRSLGLVSEDMRARWGVARVSTRMGTPADALEILESVREGFESHGMATDAALVGLDSVEILLDQGDLDEVARISEDLVQQFTAAGMRSSATEALWYFRTSLREGTFSRDVLQHVRSFIATAESQPDRPFKPLSP